MENKITSLFLSYSNLKVEFATRLFSIIEKLLIRSNDIEAFNEINILLEKTDREIIDGKDVHDDLVNEIRNNLVSLNSELQLKQYLKYMLNIYLEIDKLNKSTRFLYNDYKELLNKHGILLPIDDNTILPFDRSNQILKYLEHYFISVSNVSNYFQMIILREFGIDKDDWKYIISSSKIMYKSFDIALLSNFNKIKSNANNIEKGIKKNQPKLNWIGTPAEFGKIITELVEKGYIEGFTSISATCKIMQQIFNVNSSKGEKVAGRTLEEYFGHNKKVFTPTSIFKIPYSDNFGKDK